MTTKGAYPFAVKEEQYRKYDVAALWHARRDAFAAAESMKGVDPAAEAWYMDDVATIVAEIERRRLAVEAAAPKVCTCGEPAVDRGRCANNYYYGACKPKSDQYVGD